MSDRRGGRRVGEEEEKERSTVKGEREGRNAGESGRSMDHFLPSLPSSGQAVLLSKDRQMRACRRTIGQHKSQQCGSEWGVDGGKGN